MEGAILLAILIPIAIVVLMILLLVRMGALSRELEAMRGQMAQWKKAQQAYPPNIGEAPATPAAAPVASEPPAAPVVPPPIIVPPIVPPQPPEPAPSVEEDTLRRMREAFDGPAEHGTPSVVVEAPGPRPAPPPQPSFFERHPDLEKFIGENLINKIGIAVLVLGIGLLLRYAIGKGLINETGQTLIGLGAGGLLVLFAHRLHERFRAFSSVLIAGGIAVFYTTITIAFQQYQLIGQGMAFAVMVAITGMAVLLTLGYDRKELAVISLLGGFAAPFLVSTGEGNYRVLFTYLLILDTGMLVLAGYKKWQVINVLSLVLTVLIVGAWSVSAYTGLDPRPSWPAFGFATGFFLVFFAMNLRYNLRHGAAFTVLDHALLLVNTACYYAAGLHYLSDLPVRVTGLFTVLLGLFYLAFALHFHKREGIPRPLRLLLIGLVLTFISLAAPVQLEGSSITLFWAAEAVLLLWFAHRTGLRLIERASVIISLLMIASLAMDLADAYGDWREAPLRVMLNKGWITGMAAAASLSACCLLLARVEPQEPLLPLLRRAHWRVISLVGSVVILYLTNFLELDHQLSRSFHSSVVHQALMAYTLAFALALGRLVRNAHAAYGRAVAAILLVCGLVYITGTYAQGRNALWMLFNADDGRGFMPFHYAALALMIMAVVRIAWFARRLLPRPSAPWTLYLWAASGYIVTLASQELDVAMALGQGTDAHLDSARRVGYPLLWGIGSFAFMWYGMRTRLRTMRIIALALFAITLVKLFLFDLGALSEGGRVAAFIFLGALLLVISFMYQRLKGLFRDDATTPDQPDDGPHA
ncbi:MAG: DUF2339 domain-containing protein [Flavobacteriales bacterium]|nr:MAG: DUF2339 domain-containing protein [Flavobacteriales bacterium]